MHAHALNSSANSRPLPPEDAGKGSAFGAETFERARAICSRLRGPRRTAPSLSLQTHGQMKQAKVVVVRNSVEPTGSGVVLDREPSNSFRDATPPHPHFHRAQFLIAQTQERRDSKSSTYHVRRVREGYNTNEKQGRDGEIVVAGCDRDARE